MAQKVNSGKERNVNLENEYGKEKKNMGEMSKVKEEKLLCILLKKSMSPSVQFSSVTQSCPTLCDP